MDIIIKNPNYKDARTVALEAAAIDVRAYLDSHPEIESMTGPEVAAAVASVQALLPLGQGEIHFMAIEAGCEVKFIE